MARLVELAPGAFGHASGALWVPEQRAALLADVHLGYGWAQRRRGQLGPVRDGGLLEKVTALLDELQPSLLVLVGDLVHAPNPGLHERLFIEEALRRLAARAELLLLPGNHDRGFLRDFGYLGLQVAEAWRATNLFVVHGDQAVAPPEGKVLVVGHHHPALAIRDDAGASQKVPVFLVAKNVIVLPAFSPFAAGVDVGRGLRGELRKLMKGQSVEMVAATGRRAVRIPLPVR